MRVRKISKRSALDVREDLCLYARFRKAICITVEKVSQYLHLRENVELSAVVKRIAAICGFD